MAAPITQPVVVKDPLWVTLLMWVGFPLVGTGLGWALKAAAGWVASLKWAPWQGPFKLVDSLPEPQGTIGALAVGALAGLVFAFFGWAESLTVTVAVDKVTFKRGDKVQELDRGPIRGVFHDNKHLVLLGPATEELAREKSDLDGPVLERAFREHGYPWIAGGDPYAGRFRRWVEADPALSGSANAVLKARGQALRDDKAEDAAELRAELAKLGVVVRDDKKKQYWRSSGQAQ